MEQLIIPILIATLSLIAGRYLLPRLEKWWIHTEAARARSGYELHITPKPQSTFYYRLGNIEVPVKLLVGTPTQPYRQSEVKTTDEPIPHFEAEDYPYAIIQAKPWLIEEQRRKYGRGLEENDLPRLTHWRQGFEDSSGKPMNLYLDFTRTTFFQFLATNRSLDYAVVAPSLLTPWKRNRTIRTAFVEDPYDPNGDSLLLANPFSVHAVVISRNLSQEPQDQVIITRRSEHVALYRGYYQSSASGWMVPKDIDDTGSLSPFVTAAREARLEIADGLEVRASDFKLIGIAVNWRDLDLNAFGYFETGQAVADLLGDFRQESYETTWKGSLRFEPKAVLSHIERNKWEPVSTVALCATLLSLFDRQEVERAARSVRAKGIPDFMEIEPK
ncbi:MAG: hypothetical protein ACRDHL_13505 [Candidatus Promineifilaceae bacterium]